MSITLLFGSMIGPFSRRLMEWVHEEGHCSADMMAWDWDAFGLRMMTTAEGPGELEDVKAADHRHDQQPHQGRAVRRGAAAAGAAGPGRHGRRARRRRAPPRPRATGKTSTAGHAPARSSRRRPGPLPALPATAGDRRARQLTPRERSGGRRAAGWWAGRDCPSTGSRSSTSRGCTPGPWPRGCWPTSAPPS